MRSDLRTGNTATTPRTFHVLVIEDNDDVRDSLRALLQMHGYRVDVAADGEEGVRQALSLRPEIALVDLGLPRLNGLDVAKRLRAEMGDDIMLIACTAWGRPEDAQRALDSGFDALRVKPVDPGQLVEWLRVLGRQSLSHDS